AAIVRVPQADPPVRATGRQAIACRAIRDRARPPARRRQREHPLAGVRIRYDHLARRRAVARLRVSHRRRDATPVGAHGHRGRPGPGGAGGGGGGEGGAAGGPPAPPPPGGPGPPRRPPPAPRPPPPPARCPPWWGRWAAPPPGGGGGPPPGRPRRNRRSRSYR